jgi:hypothetical protein
MLHVFNCQQALFILPFAFHNKLSTHTHQNARASIYEIHEQFYPQVKDLNKKVLTLGRNEVKK